MADEPKETRPMQGDEINEWAQKRGNPTPPDKNRTMRQNDQFVPGFQHVRNLVWRR